MQTVKYLLRLMHSVCTLRPQKFSETVTLMELATFLIKYHAVTREKYPIIAIIVFVGRNVQCIKVVFTAELETISFKFLQNANF